MSKPTDAIQVDARSVIIDSLAAAGTPRRAYIESIFPTKPGQIAAFVAEFAASPEAEVALTKAIKSAVS